MPKDKDVVHNLFTEEVESYQDGSKSKSRTWKTCSFCKSRFVFRNVDQLVCQRLRRVEGGCADRLQMWGCCGEDGKESGCDWDICRSCVANKTKGKSPSTSPVRKKRRGSKKA